MKESDSHNPVQEMLQAMDRRDGLLWALPIVNALASHSDDDPLNWARAFFEGQLQHVQQRKRPVFETWLRELGRLKMDKPDLDHLLRLSREIWYHEGDRDALQTAISRLYEALAGLQGGQHSGYLRAVSMAVAAAVSNEAGQPIPDRVVELVESFERYRRGDASNAELRCSETSRSEGGDSRRGDNPK